MNTKLKAIVLVVLIFFTGHISFSQVATVKIDSAISKQKKTETTATKKDQNSLNLKEQQGKNQSDGEKKAVKQVKGARPDLSKSRGARPPDIVRPSGSGIPRGIGKPGGAIRRGAR